MHLACWEKEHPFVPKRNFDEVLGNVDDQVIVRDLLRRYLSDNTKELITEHFNAAMKRRRS